MSALDRDGEGILWSAVTGFSCGSNKSRDTFYGPGPSNAMRPDGDGPPGFWRLSALVATRPVGFPRQSDGRTPVNAIGDPIEQRQINSIDDHRTKMHALQADYEIADTTLFPIRSYLA